MDVSVKDLEEELQELERVHGESMRLVDFLSALSNHVDMLKASTDASGDVMERWKDMFSGAPLPSNTSAPQSPKSEEMDGADAADTSP